jgi:hypothetical protein
MKNIKTAADVAESFLRNAATLQAELDALSLEERGDYIVLVGDLPINIDGEPGKLGGMVATLRDATTFSSESAARSWAGKLVNAKGDKGTVSTVVAAYVDSITRLHKFADEFKALA